MKKYLVYGICSADDKEFKSEKHAVKYAEKLGDKCEAIWEVLDDGTRTQRDDLL